MFGAFQQEAGSGGAGRDILRRGWSFSFGYRFENARPFDIQNQIQMQEAQAEQAIKLIEVDASGKYVMSPEGAAFISQIKPPIAVISVAGMYRTGKSYLLNRMLLNRSNGFGVGPSTNPCTKGLWCWGKPIIGKTPEGDSVNVIIIDTEGIGALDEDQTHDTRIFTLAILAASSFIYNSTGSIDENALQNLSLVVNLTKNIQLNSKSSEEEEDDPEDLASYFPAFYWIVRDFSLMLINSDGDSITSKDYLERSLAPQKGFSDDIEEKNRIRRLLTSFFKERDCITLVRPLVDEKKLQLLDTLDMDELRPEFVDQVMNLRRKVLGRIKPKLFKGKELDGKMYLCMLNSYLSSINSGAIPNIENAWSYMCQEKCAQAFEQSLEYFNSEVGQNLKNSFPIEEQFLMEQLNEFKERSCDLFDSKAVGENTKFHLKELRNKLEDKIQSLKNENEMESEAILKSYFKKSIISIENKLRLSEYDKFEDFMRELNEFYCGLMDNGPSLPRRDLIYLHMLRKVIPTAAEMFLRNKSSMLDKIQSLSEEKEKTLQHCISKMKQEYKESEESQKEKITKLDREKIELEMELEENHKVMEEMKATFEEEKRKLVQEAARNQETFKDTNEQLMAKMEGLSEKVSELEGKLVSTSCERDKEYAIKDLKIEQLQAELEEIRRKSSKLELSLKDMEFAKGSEIKDITMRYEENLKNREVELRQCKNTIKELEESHLALQTQLDETKESNLLTISSLEGQLAEKSKELSSVTQDLETVKKELQRAAEEEISQLEQTLGDYELKMADMERQLKISLEQMKIKDNKYLTEKALLQQKLQFTLSESSEYRLMVSKQQEENEERVRKIMEEQSYKLRDSQQVSEQMNAYQIEIETLQKDKERMAKSLEYERQELAKEVQAWKSEYEALRKTQVLEDEKYKRVIKDLEQKISEQQSVKGEQLENVEADWRKKQKAYVDKIETLEGEMEEIKDQLEREQREERQKSEQVVLQLKNYYELQKQKLESKINAEKDKYEKKLKDIKGEYEERLKEETTDLQSEFELLKERLFETEEELMKEQNNRKNELDIKNKCIQNLEKSNEDLRSKLDAKQTDFSQKLEKAHREQQAEKEVLHAKLEELMTKNSKLQKEKSTLTHFRDQQEKMAQSKEDLLQQMKEQMAELKKRSEEGREEAKNIKNEMSTRLMEEKVEFTKKLALLEQQNQYLKKKIEDNDKSQLSFQSDYEEKVKKLKEEVSREVKSEREKAQSERQSLEEKYEKLKKAGKEKEAAQHKVIAQMEKQLAISSEKLANLSEKIRFYEERQNNDSEKYSGELSELKAAFLKEKEQLREKLESESKERERIESEKNSIIAANQHALALLENKNKFLEEGRERYKQEYEETKAKLEAIIEGNRKKWIHEKSLMETNHTEYIAKVQKKYWDEKQEVIQSHKKIEVELDSKIKQLEQQVRVLNEKVAMEEQNKSGEQIVSNRRVKQMEMNEKRLMGEIERLKTQREGEVVELQNSEKEKESLKARLREKEEKYREIEKKKQHMFYDIEKERAKWNMEKENILSKYEEQKDIISKHERDIEKLQRENEKMKMEKKCQRSSFQSISRHSNNFSIDKGHSSRSSFEDSILKENNTSQMSDTSLFFKE